MISVLICDDDADMLTRLNAEVERIFASKRMKAKVYLYDNISDISSGVLTNCDIALLDIDFHNSKCNGMDIARRIRAARGDALIIFVTNFIEYAPEGYEVQAFRYVLKRDLGSELEDYILQAIEQTRTMTRIYKIQVNGEIIDLPVKSILYLEVEQHNVTVYVQNDLPTGSNKSYSFYASLSEIEEQLEPMGFLRIHKSYLVNMRHLRKLQCREALLDTGTTLPVSEKHYREKKNQFLLWRGWL